MTAPKKQMTIRIDADKAAILRRIAEVHEVPVAVAAEVIIEGHVRRIWENPEFQKASVLHERARARVAGIIDGGPDEEGESVHEALVQAKDRARVKRGSPLPPPVEYDTRALNESQITEMMGPDIEIESPDT